MPPKSRRNRRQIPRNRRGTAAAGPPDAGTVAAAQPGNVASVNNTASAPAKGIDVQASANSFFLNDLKWTGIVTVIIVILLIVFYMVFR